MSDLGFQVPPLGRRKIRAIAAQVRAAFGMKEAWLPIVELLDLVIPRIQPEFRLIVCSRGEMGELHAVVGPDDPIIRVREDVYLGACEGKGRDRGTLAHEFGHLLLHLRPGYARSLARPRVQRYRTSEWQAKAFAGELLCSARHLSGLTSPEAMAARFGVSLASATVQWEKFREAGLI